jgi:hypothetical protein
VEGHVEAVGEQEAFNALSDNGIVTEGLWADPKALNLGQTEAPQYADAIDSAMDLASTQVQFDDLMDRYKGKRVWVIDRDKIRKRVATVVDQAIRTGEQHAESGQELRDRVADAIKGMFGDVRNVASQQPVGANQGGISPQANAILDQQLARLGNVVRQAEGVLASLQLAARRIGSFGGGGGGEIRRRVSRPGVLSEPQSEVLLEIFKHNLELVRTIEQQTLHPGADSSTAPVGSPEPAAPPAPGASAAPVSGPGQ